MRCSGSIRNTALLFAILYASCTGSTQDEIVFITRSGQRYHSSDCSYLRKSKIPLKLSEASKLGYTACSKCKKPN